MFLNPTIINNIKPQVNTAVKTLNMNFGPNHPAAHGVLRLSLGMEGETIKTADVHIGLLHRGTEKLIETKPYLLALPYFDRLDYVSMMVQEHAYCLAVEKLKKFPNFNQKILRVRTIFDELTRILNHLLAIACHALDIGSMSPIFWAFEEREKIMELYEHVSGARMHASYYRPGRFSAFWYEETRLAMLNFLNNFFTKLTHITSALNENLIWKKRLLNVGTYGYKEALGWGLTGVMLRCTGVKRDVRFNKRTTYGTYFFSNSSSFVTLNGDSLDRYLLRVQEMAESTIIINKALLNKTEIDQIPQFLKLRDVWLNFTKIDRKVPSMEKVIRDFKLWSEGYCISQGITTQYVESPKGEFGVTLMADGSNQPYRCKIRSPAYNHIQFLPKLLKNKQLADLVTLIGSIDIVFGEVDR